MWGNCLRTLIYFSTTLAVSLDAKKAFECVKWGHLFDVLDRFGLGGEFLKRVKTLNNYSAACIITDGAHSTTFLLSRGTQQDCPA